MRQLLHTLYVVEQDVELCLRGEAVEARREQETIAHIPLHNLESIVTFAFKPASPALLEACAKRGISFLAVNKSGSVRYKVIGKTHTEHILCFGQGSYTADKFIL